MLAPWGFLNAQPERGDDEVRLPRHWLMVPERAVILDIHYTGLNEHCRPEAGELAQGIVRRLLRAGYTVHFSQEYLRRELEYYDVYAELDSRPATAKRVAAVLRETMDRGAFDWEELRQIHLDAPDSEAVNRGLPWLFLYRETDRLALAEDDFNDPPKLQFTAAWEGRLVRGRAVGSSGAVEGRSYMWKIDARIRLLRGSETVTEKNYPAPPWLPRYSGFGVVPLTLQIDKIMKDLDAGLPEASTLPEPQESPPKKKKRKFLFF